MKDLTRLLAAAALGAMTATGIAALGSPANPASGPELSARLDNLQQTLNVLQTLSAKASSDQALVAAALKQELSTLDVRLVAINAKLDSLDPKLELIRSAASTACAGVR